MERHILTQEELKRILDYDPETGVFERKEIKIDNRSIKTQAESHYLNRINSLLLKKKVGTINGSGYLIISIKKSLYRAHRLAWLYIHGEFPIDTIDHINGIRTDNRLCNLRLATKSENNKNQKIRGSNTSGYKGVSFKKNIHKWEAYINVNYTKIHLGLFDNIEDARVEYEKASEKYHGKFGRVK